MIVRDFLMDEGIENLISYSTLVELVGDKKPTIKDQLEEIEFQTDQWQYYD